MSAKNRIIGEGNHMVGMSNNVSEHSAHNNNNLKVRFDSNQSHEIGVFNNYPLRKKFGSVGNFLNMNN